MKGIVKAIDDLPWVVKLILCLPVLSIVWAVYRIIKGIATGNVLMIIVGILWIVIGTTLTWLIDLISTIIWKRPVFIA